MKNDTKKPSLPTPCFGCERYCAACEPRLTGVFAAGAMPRYLPPPTHEVSR